MAAAVVPRVAATAAAIAFGIELFTVLGHSALIGRCLKAVIFMDYVVRALPLGLGIRGCADACVGACFGGCRGHVGCGGVDAGLLITMAVASPSTTAATIARSGGCFGGLGIFDTVVNVVGRVCFGLLAVLVPGRLAALWARFVAAGLGAVRALAAAVAVAVGLWAAFAPVAIATGASTAGAT